MTNTTNQLYANEHRDEGLVLVGPAVKQPGFKIDFSKMHAAWEEEKRAAK